MKRSGGTEWNGILAGTHTQSAEMFGIGQRNWENNRQQTYADRADKTFLVLVVV